MENRFTQAVLMTALFITLITGCEQIPTTSDEPPETAAGGRLLTLPQSGSTPAPEFAKSVQTNSQKVSATMIMLKQMRQQAPNAPFAGVLSLLQNPGEQEKDYTYHQVNLPFSKGITQRSEGVDLMYRYVLRTENDEILLQFEAVIPKDDKAAELVKKWIEKKIVSKAGREGKSSDSKQLVAEPVANSVGDCNAILDTGNCEAVLWVEGFGWILDCGLTVCAAAPDEWPPPPPDDPDWTDPNDCDDPTAFDCDDGTGGSSGGGGSGDDCDPGAIDQPAGCDETDDLEIILDPTFLTNQCLSSVYNQAGQAPEYQNILQNFDGEFSVANLILSAGVNSNHSTANAVTFPPNNFNIEIMFNPNRLNRPSLDVARTLIHELIHAEMFRKLLSIAQVPDLDYPGYSLQHWQDFVLDLRNNFPGLYDYYMRYEWNIPADQDPSSAQHQAMAQHYRGQIISGLKQFDSSHTDEVYEALAWVGLRGEGGIDSNTGLTSNPTIAWENLSQQERLNLINVVSDFINSNPNCQ